MSTLSPTRPSRRAATHRRLIVEDSDNEDLPNSRRGEDEEDEFTPAPQRSPKRQTRRKTTAAPSTPRTAQGRKMRTGESVEPSDIFDPEQSIPPESSTPSKKAYLSKRKSVAPAGKASVPITMNMSQHMPTPKLSVTSKLPNTVLADITTAAINEQAISATSQKELVTVNAMHSVLEKPMDIVVRSRALAMPTQPDNIGTKARTVISYLILTNFKSYAGRQVVGPFHASFSSVVGPNGSGKSNVIDSLLFVFGFRASKMRQGKISALIHNSAAHPNLDHCEVEVHFREIVDLVRSP